MYVDISINKPSQSAVEISIHQLTQSELDLINTGLKNIILGLKNDSENNQLTKLLSMQQKIDVTLNGLKNIKDY